MSSRSSPQGAGSAVAPLGKSWQSPAHYEAVCAAWDRRMEAIARKAKLGFEKEWLQDGWSELYPEPLESVKPCKKTSDALTKYAPSVYVFGKLVFAPFCTKPPPERPVLEEYQTLAKQVADLGKDRRAQVVADFMTWTTKVHAVWSTSYAGLRETPPLFACDLDIFAPASIGAEDQLDGFWVYLDDDMLPCTFTIARNEAKDSKARKPFIYSEELPSGSLIGHLCQATEEGEEAIWTAPLMQRTGRSSQAPYGFIEIQQRSPDMLTVTFVQLGGYLPEHKIVSTAVRSRHYRIQGYGEGPKMAAVQAMQRAQKEIQRL